MNSFHIYIIPLTFNQLFFIKKFRDLGVTVIGIDDNKLNFYKSEVDFFLSSDTKQIQELEKKLIKKSKSLGISALNSDFGMKESYKISQSLNLKNNFFIEENHWIYDKYQYLKLINNNLVYLPSEINSNNNKFNYIVKPRFGSGSRQISSFNRSDSYKNFKDHFLFQRKLNGTEYSVDGINCNGNPVIFTISKRSVNNFSASLIVSLKNGTKIYKEIEDYILSKIDLFPSNTVYPFHVELINDRIFGFQIIDFSPRGGGFSLGDRYITQTIGLNIHDIYLNYFKYSKISKFPKISYRYSLLYFVKFEKGVFQRIIFNKELLSKTDKYISLIKKGTKMSDPTNDSHRVGYFILSSNLKRDLNNKLNSLKSSIIIEKIK